MSLIITSELRVTVAEVVGMYDVGYAPTSTCAPHTNMEVDRSLFDPREDVAVVINDKFKLTVADDDTALDVIEQRYHPLPASVIDDAIEFAPNVPRTPLFTSKFAKACERKLADVR